MGMSNEERVGLLKKLEANSDPEKQNIEIKLNNADGSFDIAEKYQKESFLVRLWLRLKSLFTSHISESKYARILLSSHPVILQHNLMILT
jgi:hypothetical protein